MTNTKLTYLYRDASNYKLWFEVVLSGLPSEKSCEELNDEFVDSGFHPDALGFPADTFTDVGYAPYDDDPDFHEFDDLEPTNKEPTTEITADQFVAYMYKNKINIL